MGAGAGTRRVLPDGTLLRAGGRELRGERALGVRLTGKPLPWRQRYGSARCHDEDEIFEFLARLAAGGSALLLVEQYVTRVLALADYVYLLNRGSVTFAAEPGELEDEALFASYMGTDLERSK